MELGEIMHIPFRVVGLNYEKQSSHMHIILCYAGIICLMLSVTYYAQNYAEHNRLVPIYGCIILISKYP